MRPKHILPFAFAVFVVLCRGKEAFEHGLAVDLPHGWHQLHLGKGYNGVAAYCDAGIVEVLIERLPFDEEVRIGDLERQIVVDLKKEALSRLARYSGRGSRISGTNAEGERMSFVVFYPEPSAARVAILVICGEADQRQLNEVNAILDSLRDLTRE